MEFIHRQSRDIPNEGYSHRLYCHLCGKTIAACEEPIPAILRIKLEGTPCSECVKPEDYIRQLFGY